MILYFSAIGNCKYIAACIAQATEQEMVSIVDCIRENRYIFENEMIGIISPTYYWGLPNIVRDFLNFDLSTPEKVAKYTKSTEKDIANIMKRFRQSRSM